MDKLQIDYYYQLVHETLLQNQNVFTGLIPAGKDTNHAWVRDNVYASIAIWAVALAYRKIPDDDIEKSRSYELEKLMRGILNCYMMQASKVESFKHTQDKKDSLHAKFDARNCQPVVGDTEWGHLQIDATSLYLFMLAQMTESGFRIIWSTEEVAFIQNLIFYIELAYRIPDYGIWERGDKTNHGLPELNSSSVGMAKAALKALADLDLFGANNSSLSSVHVLPDECQQCSTVLENMLPRESNSKEVDSSLLSIISFPAFAVDDENLINLTRNTVLKKLLGSYGCKRFLRDGFRTALEDCNRLYYEPWELRRFEGIECEWPMFFCFLAIEAVFKNEHEYAAKYLEQIEQIVVRNLKLTRKLSAAQNKVSYSGSSSPTNSQAFPLMPESYAISGKRIDAELAKPHSQPRDAVGRVPHIWGQSLYILANLLHDGLILPGEIDPLGRRMATELKPDLYVQVVVLAENEEIKKHLCEYNLKVQTFAEAFTESGIRIYPAKVLSHLYKQLGICPKLKLTGRANKEVGILSTSRFYRVANNTIAFTPQFIDHHAFYLSLDVDFILDSFRTNVQYLRRAWNTSGRPLLIIPVYEWFFKPVEINQMPSLVSTIKKLRSGYINGTRIMLGSLKAFQETSCVTKLKFLNSNDLLDRAHGERALHRRTSPVSQALPYKWPSNHAQDLNQLSPLNFLNPDTRHHEEGIQRGALRRKSMALAHAVFSDLLGLDPTKLRGTGHSGNPWFQSTDRHWTSPMNLPMTRRRSHHELSPTRVDHKDWIDGSASSSKTGSGQRRMSLFTGIMSKATSDLAEEENYADEDLRSDNYHYQRTPNEIKHKDISVEDSQPRIAAPKLRLYQVDESHEHCSPHIRRIRVGIEGIDSVTEDPDAEEAEAHHHLRQSEGNVDHRARKAALKRIVTPFTLRQDRSPSAERASGQQTVELFQNMTPESIVELLRQTDNLAEQAEMLGRLKQLKGLDWDTNMDFNESHPTTVRELLKEVYERSSIITSWFILRYTAGLLGKRIDTLAKSLTDILVLQKQVTVGLPPEPREKVIHEPLSPCQIGELIQQACGEDSLMAMLTQEILVYLAMIARTQPQLLSQMLRLRIGLIIQMMAAELARSMQCPSTEDALFRLFSMSPFDTKRLLVNLLSGNEVRKPHRSWSATSSRKPTQIRKSTEIRKTALIAAAISLDTNAHANTNEHDASIIKEEEEGSQERTRQQWFRRRKIDGALNRCPPGFYERVYSLLERINGLRIGQAVILQSLTTEMTCGEIKFALRVENYMNGIPSPEYRQLCVEAMMVLGTMISHDHDNMIQFQCVICLDDMVALAHRLFLEDQNKYKANAILCCAKQINEPNYNQMHCCGPQNLCKHFYDTPPAGRFGTMSYMVRALTYLVKDLVPMKNERLAINCSVQ